MANFSSSFKMSISSSHPSWPLYCKAHITGLLIKTALAPKARHFITSVPRVIPESTKIVQFGFTFLTEVAIVFRTLIDDGADLGLWLPPFEIQIPSAPSLRAYRPSSSVMIPFIISLASLFIIDLILFISDNEFSALSIKP